MGIGWAELLLILVVALLVFGPNKLPDIARGLGKGIRDLRRAMSGFDDPPTSPTPLKRMDPTVADKTVLAPAPVPATAPDLADQPGTADQPNAADQPGTPNPPDNPS